MKLNFVVLVGVIFSSLVAFSGDRDRREDRRDDSKSKADLLVKIEVKGESEASDERDLRRRVRRLEMAINQLQKRVFMLEEDEDDDGEMDKFSCSVSVCRGSVSMWSDDLDECNRYRTWRDESTSVWAQSQYEAEQSAEAAIRKDSDIKFFRNLNCIPMTAR